MGKQNFPALIRIRQVPTAAAAPFAAGLYTKRSGWIPCCDVSARAAGLSIIVYYYSFCARLVLDSLGSLDLLNSNWHIANL